MAADAFNSVGGYTVGIPPITILDSNGNLTVPKANIAGNLYISNNLTVVGDIADGDTAGSGCVAVDVVVADAVADDRLDPPHGGDDVGIDRGKLRDHRIGIGDRGGEDGRILGTRIDDRASGPLENRPFEIDVVKRPVGDHDLHESPLPALPPPKSPAVDSRPAAIRECSAHVEALSTVVTLDLVARWAAEPAAEARALERRGDDGKPGGGLDRRPFGQPQR